MSTYMLGKPALCNRSASYLFKSAFHCFLFFELREFNFSTESSHPASPLLSTEVKSSCCMLSQNGRSHQREPEHYDTFFSIQRFREPFSNVSLLPFSPSRQSNGWDPNDMFKFNEEKYGVLSTYDSSLSTYTYVEWCTPLLANLAHWAVPRLYFHF